MHRAYIDAGASVIVTASYQVSREGFIAVGRSAEDADAALRASVDLARDAAGDTGTLVAASIGPFGAILHDGSEYRGRYGVSRDRLVEFHAERLEVIAAAGPDLLAVETVPDLDEVDALVEVLGAHPDLPAWLTMTCADSGHTSAGQRIEELPDAVRKASSIRAVGVNCSAPEYVGEILGRLSDAGARHLVAYPNAGRAWSPATGWSGEGSAIGIDLLSLWRQVPGVALVGGCCGIGPSDIAAVAAALDGPGEFGGIG